MSGKFVNSSTLHLRQTTDVAQSSLYNVKFSYQPQAINPFVTQSVSNAKLVQQIMLGGTILHTGEIVDTINRNNMNPAVVYCSVLRSLQDTEDHLKYLQVALTCLQNFIDKLAIYTTIKDNSSSIIYPAAGFSVSCYLVNLLSNTIVDNYTVSILQNYLSSSVADMLVIVSIGLLCGSVITYGYYRFRKYARDRTICLYFRESCKKALNNIAETFDSVANSSSRYRYNK